MAVTLRDRIKESLAIGAAIGVLTMVVALLSIMVDSASEVFERTTLAEPSGSVVATKKVDDPYFRRVYALKNDSGPSFGLVFSARSRDASAIFGAVYSPKGELRSLKIIGTCTPRLPGDARAALDYIEGSERILDRASKAVISAAEAGS
jgi:hypothetical protein